MADFPIKARNRIDTIRRADFELANQTRDAIDRVANAIPDGGANLGELRRIADASKGMEASLKQIADAHKETKLYLATIAKATTGVDLNTRTGRSGETDNVTALYAAAIDTSGDVVERTIPGRWFVQAKFPTLKSIVDFGQKKPTRDKRDEFARRMIESAGSLEGLPAIMKQRPEELRRFFDLAPGVLAAIEAAGDPAAGAPGSGGNPA